MKKALTSFFRFARAEKLGWTLVIIIIMAQAAIRYALSQWVHPPVVDSAQQARMLLAYNEWKDRENALGKRSANAASPAINASLFAFDPNTLDSAGFIRLGMPPRAVKSLLNWRSKGKHFRKPADLKPLYNLPPEVYARLEPYIRIENEPSAPYSSGLAFKNNFAAIPTVIDLNAADSALLDRGVPGIGAVLAHKIIQRRMALGGFFKYEQLLEVYKFPDSTFQRMKEKLRISPASVKQIGLNTTTFAQLSAHPYIGEKVAKNILMYREGIKHYESVEQLRQVPLMNEEIYRKIAPYFKVD